jgi:hypothetical protein
MILTPELNLKSMASFSKNNTFLRLLRTPISVKTDHLPQFPSDVTTSAQISINIVIFPLLMEVLLLYF